MAPLIVLTEPEIEEHDTTLPQVNITGFVVDNREIKNVQCRINGVELAGTRGVRLTRKKKPGAPGPDASPVHRIATRRFAFPATLREGANRVTIEVSDDEGLMVTKELSISYAKPRGSVYVVAVGVNDYSHEDIPDLKCAVADARAVADAFARGLDVPPENITLLTDEKAGARAIELALGKQLRGKLGKSDTVIVYYSGHGAPEEDPSAPEGVEKVLLPYDADPVDLSVTGLPMKDMGRLLDKLHCERVVFLADTCYSGAAGGRSLENSGLLRAVRLKRKKESIDERLEGTGRIIMTASTGAEVAKELPNLGHGVFTYYLVEGLKGAADANGDSRVTAQELYDHVSGNVLRETAGAQHPQISKVTAGEFLMTYVRGEDL